MSWGRACEGEADLHEDTSDKYSLVAGAERTSVAEYDHTRQGAKHSMNRGNETNE